MSQSKEAIFTYLTDIWRYENPKATAKSIKKRVVS